MGTKKRAHYPALVLDKMTVTHWCEEPDYKLESGVIDIWLCQAEPVKGSADYFHSILSDEERSRAERFKFALHRERFIISHGFQRSVLARYLNITPSHIQYQKGDKGKPSLLESDYDSQALTFNLSHTEDLTLLAITCGREVGIDIEHMKRKTDWLSIGQRFFTKPEQQALFSLDEEDQKAAFFQLWTRKEAYMKVLGCGLSLAPTSFTLTVSPQPPALIRHHSTTIAASMSVEFTDVVLPETLADYCATLAVESSLGKFCCYQYSKTETPQ
ncbi:MAG: 4'-phosphopantetheinyl transferase superfamily protein [Candidatus Polarisedimenticolaceae bacterium]|nr:4'-phosphopantetheinyl transferase superfamily protein [Candidatus Polarisedimenticolaceae bacterium]